MVRGRGNIFKASPAVSCPYQRVTPHIPSADSDKADHSLLQSGDCRRLPNLTQDA